MNEEHRANVEQMKEIMVERRTGNSIMFEKVDKKVLNVLADKVNKTIKYLKVRGLQK